MCLTGFFPLIEVMTAVEDIDSEELVEQMLMWPGITMTDFIKQRMIPQLDPAMVSSQMSGSRHFTQMLDNEEDNSTRSRDNFLIGDKEEDIIMETDMENKLPEEEVTMMDVDGMLADEGTGARPALAAPGRRPPVVFGLRQQPGKCSPITT
jgi:hypothetical protein